MGSIVLIRITAPDFRKSKAMRHDREIDAATHALRWCHLAQPFLDYRPGCFSRVVGAEAHLRHIASNADQALDPIRVVGSTAKSWMAV